MSAVLRFRYEVQVGETRDRKTGAVLKPQRTVPVELAIDRDDLMRRLGSRAVGSRGGKAIEAGGAVSVRVLR